MMLKHKTRLQMTKLISSHTNRYWANRIIIIVFTHLQMYVTRCLIINILLMSSLVPHKSRATKKRHPCLWEQQLSPSWRQHHMRAGAPRRWCHLQHGATALGLIQGWKTHSWSCWLGKKGKACKQVLQGNQNTWLGLRAEQAQSCCHLWSHSSAVALWAQKHSRQLLLWALPLHFKAALNE